MRIAKASCWRTLGSWLMLVLLLPFAASCQHDHHQEPDTSVSRTVIVFMAAENTLYEFSVGYESDITEMLQGVGYMTANDHLVVYHDGVGLPAIFHIDQHTKATAYAELRAVYTAQEDMNSASAETLRFVLDYATKHYPAQEYAIVFWSHASGWVPSTYDAPTRAASKPRRSFGIDNGTNSSATNYGPQMEISDLAEALSHYPQFEFIFFDACFMQCIEVAYELRAYAKYLVSSPAEIPGPGAPYHLVMKDFFAEPADVKGLIDHYHDYHQGNYGSLLSAIDCAQMEDFADTLHSILQPHKEQLLAMRFSDVLDYWKFDHYYYQYDYPDYYDILGIMRQAHAQEILSDDELTRFESALERITYHKNWTSQWWSMVQGWQNVDETQYSGISMFLPLAKYSVQQKIFYDAWFQTPWAKAVWNE